MEGLLSVLKSFMIRSPAQVTQFSKIWERESKINYSCSLVCMVIMKCEECKTDPLLEWQLVRNTSIFMQLLPYTLMKSFPIISCLCIKSLLLYLYIMNIEVLVRKWCHMLVIPYTQYLCSSGCVVIMFVFYKYPCCVYVLRVGVVLSVETASFFTIYQCSCFCETQQNAAIALPCDLIASHLL